MDDGTPFEIAKLMDEIRDLMLLALESSPDVMTRLEMLMQEIREIRAVALKCLEAGEDSEKIQTPTPSMEAIRAWSEIIDSETKPTYH